MSLSREGTSGYSLAPLDGKVRTAIMPGRTGKPGASGRLYETATAKSNGHTPEDDRYMPGQGIDSYLAFLKASSAFIDAAPGRSVGRSDVKTAFVPSLPDAARQASDTTPPESSDAPVIRTREEIDERVASYQRSLNAASSRLGRGNGGSADVVTAVMPGREGPVAIRATHMAAYETVFVEPELPERQIAYLAGRGFTPEAVTGAVGRVSEEDGRPRLLDIYVRVGELTVGDGPDDLSNRLFHSGQIGRSGYDDQRELRITLASDGYPDGQLEGEALGTVRQLFRRASQSEAKAA